MEKQIKDRFKKIENRVGKIERFIEKEGLSKNGRLIHCDGINKETKKPCGYSWISRSNLNLISCPKCGKKVKIS